jgi:imidazolonepropionase-like amidohydrolase
MTDAAISAGQVLLGPAGESIQDGMVVVRNGIVTDCGPRSDIETRIPNGVPRRDFPNSTLLPGLINSHVHLAFDTSDDPVSAYEAASPEELVEGMSERAARALNAGITTVRDLGGPTEVFTVRDSIASGARPGPRIVASGPPLTAPRGHCWFFGGEVDLATGAEHNLREIVRRNATAGADLIKVMASGGHMTPGGPSMFESQFTTEQLRTIVDEASKLGLRVAAHAHGADAITSAAEAGVVTIEHCGWMTGPGSFDRREHVARQMAAKKIYACAALNQDWMPFYHRLGERAQGVFGRFTWMDKLGVPFISGTDAGLPGSVFDNYAGALGLYAWLGFPNSRTIEFATVNAADALGLADVTGRIARGFASDLLVVDGDPLADLNDLFNVRLVVTPTLVHTPEVAQA